MEVVDKDADDVMMFQLVRYEVCLYGMFGGLLFLRCWMYLHRVGAYLRGPSHCWYQHQQTECCLLKLVVCTVGYTVNVGTVDRKTTADYHDLDDVMNLSGKRRLPLRRPAEVGSSSNSCLFTGMTHTFQKMIFTHVGTEHTSPCTISNTEYHHLFNLLLYN